MNDWIVANLNNPDFSASDFKDLTDMTIDNTQLLKKEEYLKSEYIRNNPLFLDESGTFIEDKFNQYYDNLLTEFLKFQIKEFPEELDMFDTDRTSKTKVRNDNFVLGRGINPDRLKIGIEGVNVWSAPDKTRSELAQASNIYDTESGEFKDYSPNDHSLVNNPVEWFKSLFEDPLVLAKWDEEGTHIDPFTGLEKKHAKGDYKYNDKGTYYYETLGDRSPMGKEVLSVLDNLTVDGVGINKYDFFDADDVEKSVSGVIAKNVAAIAPVFIPYVGVLYSTLFVARELAKSLPMLHGIVTMFGDSETPDWMNSVVALAEKFTGSTSLYAKENVFSFENFGNLISDVALQWNLQELIAESVNRLRGTHNLVKNAEKKAEALFIARNKGVPDENWKNTALGLAALNKFVSPALSASEKASKWGRDASLVYMSVVSNSDVFNDMQQRGATKLEAAAVALGSTIGMFAVDKTGLGELMFDNNEVVRAARGSLTKEIEALKPAFNAIKNADIPQTRKYLNFINEGIKAGKKVVNKFSDDIKYHTTNFTEKAIGEGLEEVSEELVTDMSKTLYELAGQLGASTTLKDVGSWDNAGERYLMSFLGGTIGGGIFYGQDLYKNGFRNRALEQEMVTLIKNGHAQDLRDLLAKLTKKEKVGSASLSAYDFAEKDGLLVWLTAKNKQESLNLVIANIINDRINQIEASLNNNLLNISDEEAFQRMILAEHRYNNFKNVAPITNYYLDLNNLTLDLINAEKELKLASGTIDGTLTGAPATDNMTEDQKAIKANNLIPFQEKVDLLKEKRNLFLSGDTSLDYTRKLTFALDPILHSPFLDIDLFDLEVDPSVRKEKLTAAWDKFKKIEQFTSPEIALLALNGPEFKKWWVKFLEVINSGIIDGELFSKSTVKYEDKLEGETDEEYNNRNTRLIDPITGELEEEVLFKDRVSKRILRVKEANRLKSLEYVQRIKDLLEPIGYNVDPTSLSWLRNNLPLRVKDVIREEVSTANLTIFLKSVLDSLKPDLSNREEVINSIEVSHAKEKYLSLKLVLNELTNLKLYFADGSGEFKKIDSAFFEEMNLLGLAITAENIINKIAVLDPTTDSDLVISNESIEKLLNILKQVTSVVGDSADISVLPNLFSNYFTDKNSRPKGFDFSYFDALVQKESTDSKKKVQDIINQVGYNPIFELNLDLNNIITNPVIEMTKSLAGKVLGDEELPNIEQLLLTIEQNYLNLEDSSNLILDENLIKTLSTASDALSLVYAYIYAASTTAHNSKPVGHNKVMNEFARNHKDVVEKWEELPELDEDFGNMYLLQIRLYLNRIDNWIKLSNLNQTNKVAQFEKIDKALNKSLKNLLSKTQLKATLDGLEIDLLKGYVENEDDEISVYDALRVLYQNFQNALNSSLLSVEDFLELTGILNELFNIADQTSIQLAPNSTHEHFTDFDKVLFIALALSLDPVLFYSKLKTRVERDAKTAPISLLEYDSKLAIAATTQLFKDIMSYAFKKTKDKRYHASNSVAIMGPAGVGKTLAVVKPIKDYFADDEILVSGPTETQSEGLKKSLGVTNSKNVYDLLRDILGSVLYNEIRLEVDSQKWGQNNGIASLDKEYKYFTAFIGSDGICKYNLKPVTFNDTAPKPKVLIIDEATHLSSIWVQALDLYMRHIGGTLVLIGDLNQNGYFREGMGNIREADMFIARPPRLITSLRDNNIQKLNNLNNVLALLEEARSNKLKLTVPELQAYWPLLAHKMSILNFRVYNELNINGDLVIPTLDVETAKKLKLDGKTVGFVGDKTSQAFLALTAAGITPTILTSEEILGQEFDYVVIDKLFETPKLDYNILKTLLDIYTLMSRGREASIFIDNGLSDIIGNNEISKYQAKAPSLLATRENGLNIIEILKAKKLELLNKFNLEPLQITGEVNPIEVFKDPDTLDLEVKEVINSIVKEDESKELTSDNDNIESYIESLFVVPGYGDVTFLSVNTYQDTRTGKNGKEYTGNVWQMSKNTEILRNLNAISDKGEVFWFKDKLALLKELGRVKSAILFGHNWNDVDLKGRQLFPQIIKKNFSKDEWDKRTYEIEIREANEILPLFPSLPDVGLEYKGKKYIANIVCKVKNKDGKTCIFDLGGLNNPETLAKNLPTIKNNISEKLSKPSLSSEEKNRLNNVLNTIDGQSTKYAALFESWINEFNTKGSFNLDVTNAVELNKTTWFRKDNTSIRFGGNVDPETLNENDWKDAKHVNPNLVFSRVYTYASEELKGIDLSVKGKAVAFVSSDTLLDPDELINYYIALKNNPSEHRPRVRMIVLNNYGLTMSLMYDPKFISAFLQGTELVAPFKLNFVGMHMFVSLWNWRTALKKFNNILKTWRDEHEYSPEKVNTIIKAALALYNDKTYDITKVGVTLEDIDNLNHLNKVLLLDIPIFRLGYSTKEGNGFHILKDDVSESKAYDQATANLLYITPEKANIFYRLSNDIINGFIGDYGSLGLKLRKEDKSLYTEDDFIDIKNAKHRRGLAGLMKFSKNTGLRIEYDGKSMLFPEGEGWSAIPLFIGSILKTTTYFLYNPEELSNTLRESARVYWYNAKDERLTTTLQIGEWIDGPNQILKTKFDNTGSGHPDRSLADMFDLAFHGTTQDIHEKPIQITGVQFPNGFYIHPQASVSKESLNDNFLEKILFLKIDTDEALFTMDSKVRSAGINLFIDRISKKESSKRESEKIIETEETVFINQIDLESGRKFTTLEEAIKWKNNLLLNMFLAELSEYENPLGALIFRIRAGSHLLDSKVNVETLLTILGRIDTSDKVSIDNDNILIKKGSKEYYLQKDFELVPKEENKTEEISLEDFNNIFAGFDLDMLNEMNENTDWAISEDDAKDFIEEVRNIILSNTLVKENISELMEEYGTSKDYDTMANYIKLKNEELYNQLFEDC